MDAEREESVTACLSAVSLAEGTSELHPQSDLLLNRSDGNLSYTSTEVSDVGMLPTNCLSENVECCRAFLQPGVWNAQEEASSQEEKQAASPSWAEMLPDALAKIFSRLSVKELLCTIPAVCRYWLCVSKDPSCWHTIDLSEWSYDKQAKIVDKMLLLLIQRSQGCLQRVCVPHLQNDSMLQLIANSASQLQVLQIPDSFVSEECLCEVAPKARALTYLDISGRFPSKALMESFGKHCKLITRLNMNMRLNTRESKSSDIAALTIAENMPQLQHLEMAYGLLSSAGLRALLEKCGELKHLDLRGCWHLDVEDGLLLEARKRINVFFSPVVKDDVYDMLDYDIDSEEYADVILSDFMFEDPEYYEELMYDDLDEYMEDDIAEGHSDWEDEDDVFPF